ncbi:hypothetical protein EDB81DRAFT_253192 [Dactylonectria macrodidyma]|uniref:NACHT domain-containing protein n=1 Tax=Dactylonectria macrodidyma TaxID=307937 RepID=A0A9P9JJQ6_9HYPO|nr:hypothetical protein EDB81DRAFT_253192 [Dactylonectria macrodidyma]
MQSGCGLLELFAHHPPPTGTFPLSGPGISRRDYSSDQHRTQSTEIMAANTSISFTRSLEKFRQELSDDQKQQFSTTGLEEVKRAMQQIQDQIGPDKKLRNFTRLKKFFEGMKQMEELVKIFLQVHEVVAFIWGPIKFVMMIAATRIDILELVLGVYQDIGDMLDGLGRYRRIFKRHPEARGILETYFDDVLQFHSGVLHVFSKQGWKRFFSYAWPTFKTRFRPIIDSLKRHRALLSDEKLTVVIDDVQELSTDFNDRLAEIREAIKEKKTKHQDSVFNRKAQVNAKIGPLDYESDQRTASKQRYVTSGTWVLEDPRFTKWAEGNMARDNILFLHGIPGSGKTTLASCIIDHMRSKSHKLNGPVAFFYFKHNLREGTRRTKGEMFRAILAQLLTQDDALLEYMHHQCADKSKAEISLGPFLEDCMKHCLMNQKRVWIILDGLDECDEEYDTNKLESEQVIRWFQEVALPLSCQTRLLISGQRDGHIEAMLSKAPEISLDTSQRHFCDIEGYTRSRASLIRERFSLNPDEELDVVTKVSSVSKGMFLYAKIVLDNLLCQESPADLDDELTQDNFPQGLDAAYERVVIRVLDRPSPARKKSVAGILGWLVCSARPLRWREIQSRFCINLENSTCNFRNRRVDSCKIICGSLVETEPCEYHEDSVTEQNIRLVHSTASRYLINTGRVRLVEEHAKMAMYCSQYLTTRPFSQGLGASTIEETALTGYYGILDYAVEYLQHHTEAILFNDSEPGAQFQKNVTKSVEHLLETFSSYEPDEGRDLATKKRALLQRMTECLGSGSDSSSILYRVTTIRKMIEAIDPSGLDDHERAAFLDLNGLERFKCPRIQCSKFASGFEDQTKRDLHVREHERPFKCPVEGCYARVLGFTSESDLVSHSRRFHTESSDLDLFSKPRRREISDMHSAISRGDLEQVKILHKKGHSLFKPIGSTHVQSPLVVAVRKGQARICEYLLQQGVNPASIVWRKTSPLGETVKQKDTELFHLLHSYSDMTEESHFVDMVSLAIVEDCGDMLDSLLAASSTKYVGQNLGRIWDQLMHLNGCLGNSRTTSTSMLQRVVQLQHHMVSRVHPSLYTPDGKTLTHHRMRTAGLASRELFSTLCSPSSSSCDTILEEACIREAWAVAECLVDLATPELWSLTHRKIRSTPLHTLAGVFCKGGFDEACVKNLAQKLILLDQGMSVNMKDNDGNLPLHIAARQGHGIFDLLVEHTKNLHEQNARGETALKILVHFGRVAHVRQLVESGGVDFNTDMKALLELVDKCQRPEARMEIRNLLLGSRGPS